LACRGDGRRFSVVSKVERLHADEHVVCALPSSAHSPDEVRLRYREAMTTSSRITPIGARNEPTPAKPASATRTAPSAQISYTTASEWADKAPSEIRDATDRFATIQKRFDITYRLPDDYREVRAQIAEYAEDHCPEPLTCIADVEGNPRLPCY
jgi:hypothetical protein